MEVLSIQERPGALHDIGDYTKTTWVPTLFGNKGILRNSRKQHQAFTETHKVGDFPSKRPSLLQP